MRVTFLGTGAGVPSRERNVSSVAVRLPQSAETWLFDCGEGTQHTLIRSDVRMGQITRIFISHLHGDHLFGLPGLLSTCGMSTQGRRIDVYGNAEVKRYLQASLLPSGADVTLHEVEPGQSLDCSGLTVTTAALLHRVDTLGYRIDEPPRSGHFDAERAAALGVPAGPLYARLKRGESIPLSDGRIIDGHDLCGPARAGRALVYCSDTVYTPAAVELARGADLLIHEATFSGRNQALADQRHHSTTETAARVAFEAGVGRLIITHISPRYASGSAIGPDELVSEARAIFPATDIAYDMMVTEV